MLAVQFLEEQILELCQCSALLAGDGDGLCLVLGGVDLDQGLQLVIIDIVWADGTLVSHGAS